MSEQWFNMVCEYDVAMPMRDGTVLRANVYRPADDGTYPGLLQRTPYGKAGPGALKMLGRLVREGYVVVSQDIRGRHASDGTFISMLSEHHTEAEDGYDSVQWLAQQPYCNGTVGLWGVSYDAWTTWYGAGAQPPALAAISPWSIPVELRDLDWTDGSFRPARRVHWLLNTMAPDLRRRHGMSPPHDKAQAQQIWQDLEQAQRLGMVPWCRLVDQLPPELARDFGQWLQEPNRRVWKLDEVHAQVTVPQLNVCGWFDHCISIGHLPGMQRCGGSELARRQAKLIVGPWSHATLGGRRCGTFDFGPDAEVDVWDLRRRWFDHWLKGIDNGVADDPAVRYFVMGANQWKSSPCWPVEVREWRSLYLGDAADHPRWGALVEQPAEREGADEYVYDPHHPVPTLWDEALVQHASDRTALEHREDILYYRTPPLTEAVEITGQAEVELYIASSAVDTDFFAHLVDESPDGTAMEIAHGMVRARYRESFEQETPLEPGAVTMLRIRLGPTACRFLPGHRIRLEITSSNFPNYDRNHNTGGNDLFESEMTCARQSVFHGGQRPSRLILPIVEA